MSICLLGASFQTGNLGVSALAESSIKLILSRWPDAQITLLGGGYIPGEQNLMIGGRTVNLEVVPIRFSRNILLSCHFLRFVFYGVLARLLPKSQMRNRLISHNPCCRALVEADFVADMTGGDSFSDTYGFGRFFYAFLRKWLVLLYGKKLILMPQTYGPFRSRTGRMLARYVLRRAEAVFAREQRSLKLVQDLIPGPEGHKARFVQDVAFVLDKHKPKRLQTQLDGIGHRVTMVGLNINGLVYNGGYTRNNMFGLKSHYPEFIRSLLENILSKDDESLVLLVPHVFPPAGYEVESDTGACEKICEQLGAEFVRRIILVKGPYDHKEIKYIIGSCDFFIGSRMHACIAALSQCIPTVGVAYSGKFAGVFESIGLLDCVADARVLDERGLIEKVWSVFQRRDVIRKHLEQVIPQVRENIQSVFNSQAV